MHIALDDILNNIEVSQIVGDKQKRIDSICFDSRQANSNCAFIAVRGTVSDGHNYIQQAIEKGATVIVCEQIPESNADVTFVQCPNTAEALGIIASIFYGNPSSELKLVGITGTNGKTTIASLLYDLFTKAGFKVGLLSTICIKIGEDEVPTNHTTPDAITINKMLAEMVELGCNYCFMEVSSHSIAQFRIAGLQFAGGVFTNITRDHLDYHETFANYINAKKAYFDALPKTAFALVNQDDKNGMVMLQNTKANKKTYGLKTFADFKAHLVEHLLNGMLLNIDNTEVWVKLIGTFNAYNLLAIYATAKLLELDTETILQIMSTFNPVNGRFETLYSPNGFVVVVDYAHTPDALENVLNTINDIRQTENQLITVVGAGGNRDKGKRPMMANIAVKQSDKVILTSDNPRFENPEEIIKDMQEGIQKQDAAKVVSITDRLQAIRTACMLANKGDIILIAGKGHEDYQEVNGVKHHFDDKEVVREQFSLLN